jgi:hypothetical protein
MSNFLLVPITSSIFRAILIKQSNQIIKFMITINKIVWQKLEVEQPNPIWEIHLIRSYSNPPDLIFLKKSNWPVLIQIQSEIKWRAI